MPEDLINHLVSLLEDEENRILCQAILGIAEAHDVAAFIQECCMTSVHQRVRECLYIGFSIGASFGLRLDDGYRIFLKFSRPSAEEGSIPLETHRAMALTQVHLHQAGFPCPQVIIPPFEFKNTIVSISRYTVLGEQVDAHRPAIRREMARSLAQLINLAEPCSNLEGFAYHDIFRTADLYPPPHNALFDFTPTAAIGRWIDEIVMRAKTTLNAAERHIVLGHSDWSMKNMRLRNGEVVMVYDWDSLCLLDECHHLGTAAATFPTTWDIPVLITPSQAEALAFAEEYETARGKPFSAAEWQRIAAYATYVICYTSRCELCLDPHNENLEGSYRQALQEMQGDFYILPQNVV